MSWFFLYHLLRGFGASIGKAGLSGTDQHFSPDIVSLGEVQLLRWQPPSPTAGVSGERKHGNA